MKLTHGWTGLLLALAFSGMAQGQVFDSGSDGSFGAIDLKYPDDCPEPNEYGQYETWINLPPDGIIHATTVTIEGCVLRFTNNARNTPVYLLAQGDIIITASQGGATFSGIDVSGFQGTGLEGGTPGPGGFPGGRSGTELTDPGPGAGPGGGGPGFGGSDELRQGRGIYCPLTAGSRPRDGQSYSSQLLMPLIGGSGGGGSAGYSLGLYGASTGGGGGGSGAILIASNTRIFIESNLHGTASITAAGGRGYSAGHPNFTWSNFAGGSGGAVRLVAPIVEGDGYVDVTGSAQNHGRVRIDALNRPIQISIGTQCITIGRLMKTFLDITPRLDITHAAGTNIPLDTSTPVLIVLPIGAPPEQSITLRAEGFTGTVPVRVQALLENGEAIVIDDTITMSGSVTSKTLPITLPENIGVRFYAWTREE